MLFIKDTCIAAWMRKNAVLSAEEIECSVKMLLPRDIGMHPLLKSYDMIRLDQGSDWLAAWNTQGQTKTEPDKEVRFRCTRSGPYRRDCPGTMDKRARQEYYLGGSTYEEALRQMASQFPDDVSFTVDVWLE